jgi:hypothetical protein
VRAEIDKSKKFNLAQSSALYFAFNSVIIIYFIMAFFARLSRQKRQVFKNRRAGSAGVKPAVSPLNIKSEDKLI